MTFGEWMQGISAIGFALLLCATSATAQDQPKLNLMPMPANLQTGSGDLRIDSSFSVALTGHTEPRLDREVAEETLEGAIETRFGMAGKGDGKGGVNTQVAAAGHTEPRLDRAVQRFLRQLARQ